MAVAPARTLPPPSVRAQLVSTVRRSQCAELRVAVVDEHEIFSRGLVASLRDDPGLHVVHFGPERLRRATPPLAPAFDVAVVSDAIASELELGCRLVVCGNGLDGFHQRDDVLAVLPRWDVTSQQLVAAVRGAAAGLRVSYPLPGLPKPFAEVDRGDPLVLERREVEVVRLLASGFDTRAIAAELSYSERTVKGIVHDILVRTGCRTRAQAVGVAVRRGVI